MGLKNRSAQFVFAMLCWRVGLSTAGEEDRQRPLAAVEGATSARSRYRFVSRVVLLFCGSVFWVGYHFFFFCPFGGVGVNAATSVGCPVLSALPATSALTQRNTGLRHRRSV